MKEEMETKSGNRRKKWLYTDEHTWVVVAGLQSVALETPSLDWSGLAVEGGFSYTCHQSTSCKPKINNLWFGIVHVWNKKKDLILRHFLNNILFFHGWCHWSVAWRSWLWYSRSSFKFIIWKGEPLEIQITYKNRKQYIVFDCVMPWSFQTKCTQWGPVARNTLNLQIDSLNTQCMLSMTWVPWAIGNRNIMCLSLAKLWMDSMTGASHIGRSKIKRWQTPFSFMS